MPKVTTERRKAEASSSTAAARYTSGRALHSAYCPKPGPVGGGKEPLAGGPVKVAPKTPLPRVWNCNKPKILKSFNVYGKQALQPTGKAAKTTTVRRWVNPPYPVDRPKTKNRGDGPRNYDTLYVPLDDDDRVNATAQIPQPALGNISKAVEAKRRQVYINRWTQLEANQEVLKEEQPPFRQFPCLLPAGERHSLKVQTSNDDMVKLIAEVREIRQQLCIGSEPPLPPPPQFAGEFQPPPPPLVRSRTQTYFSICDCPHPKLYEYVRRLPHASTPFTP
ncbi:hypothetical protein KR059_006323, partial [Drosophila kikkawai]